MILKNYIESIFKDNTNYINASQAVNQASSLDALSSDLYTDSTRFIYELLQNADDSSKDGNNVKVWIKVFGDNLVIAHTGTPFSIEDVRGICNVNNGTKKSDINKTGYKGIGFKSVFGQSKNVTIYTDKEYFKFDSFYEHEWKWDGNQEEWEKQNQRDFQYPWQIIPIYMFQSSIPQPICQYIEGISANVATIVKLKNVSETLESINRISSNTNLFLFLKNISQITFDLEQTTTISIDRSSDTNISLMKDGKTKGDWLIKTIHLDVPEEIRKKLSKENNIPEKLKEASSIEMTLAAKLNKYGICELKTEDKLLYSYLPTDERKYQLPVLVNTNFLTSANRESLHANSKWNSWIFEEIAVEIFKWISELRLGEFGSQAYKLIPKKLSNKDLGESFNKGIDKAVKTTKFILSVENELITIGESILDYTLLSNQQIVTDLAIRQFLAKIQNKAENTNIKRFAKDFDYFFDLERLGAQTFKWETLKPFLVSKEYLDLYSYEGNIKLILFLKEMSELENNNGLTNHFVSQLSFIVDHKNIVQVPSKVCFPEPGDRNWNNIDSELSFIHPSLFEIISKDSDTRKWLEGLGMIEKTDITFITQNIIPQIATYTTKENAYDVVNELFNLYKKESLNNDILEQLSELRLLTSSGELYPANDCYFSNFYNPRLNLEDLLETDNIISGVYCLNPNEKDEMKLFLKRLGVKENITKKVMPNRYSFEIEDDIDEDYFIDEDKIFTPFVTSFRASQFNNIVTLGLINQTVNNYDFALAFWSDYIKNHTPDEIKQPAVAFWGYSSHPGWKYGDEVENYIPWTIKNLNSIPTLLKTCETTNNIFLNTNEIQSIGSNYLPIFDGPELTSDWKAFFKFKTNLDLEDYLIILEKISTDLNTSGKVKEKNYERIQKIYSVLLEECIYWGDSEKEIIREYSTKIKLLNTKKTFESCNNLNCFIDGNETIFQDQYSFILLDIENKKSPNLELFLSCFGVQMLKQDDFGLISENNIESYELKTKLLGSIPFLINWINSTSIPTKLESISLRNIVEDLVIIESDSLEISYSEINFRKKVNTHYTGDCLYVSNPWDSNSVLINLPNLICKHLCIAGNEDRLDFLLRSSYGEINEYFVQESIPIPDSSENILLSKDGLISFDRVNENSPNDNVHHSEADYRKYLYVEGLVERSVKNIMAYLGELSEYDCSGQFRIAHSIIGGIKKDGVDITIVARPSDNEQVILFYGSEFDVLNYANAELWYEDGCSIPKKMTIGQVFEKAKINKISVPNLEISTQEIHDLASEKMSTIFEFSPIPYAPTKISQVISSFSNTEGGRLVFGIQENLIGPNDIIGLSLDYQMNKIMEKTISNLNLLPKIESDWIQIQGKSLFIIKVEKSQEDVLCDGIKYTRDNTKIISETDSIIQKRRLAKADFNNTKAVIIAIEDYHPSVRKQIQSVKHARADAMAFKDMLQNSMGVKEEDIQTYIDENAFGNQLEHELNQLFSNLNEDDRLIFYYAGHGFHDGITNYLSTYDIHPSNIVGTSLSLNKILLDPLKQSECKNALIFIDACAHKVVIENERTVVSDFQDEDFKIITHQFPYYAIFLSCQVGESSFGSNRFNHGIWTYHLIDAIKGNHPEIMKGRNYLTDSDLQQYLTDVVPASTLEEFGRQQHPKSILDSHCENIINVFNE